MPGRPRTRLSRVLDDLGGVLLEPVAGAVRRGALLDQVVIHDPLDTDVQGPADRGAHGPPDTGAPDAAEPLARAVVLGVGVRAADDLVRLLRGYGRRGATALVVRQPVDTTPGVLRAAEESGVALLGLAAGASWAQLAAMLRTVLAEEDLGDASPGTLDGVPAGDLFAVANAVAALLDAPVTIEDRASRVLAFSGRQDEADQPRARTILGRQVPEHFTRHLRANGVFERLYREPGPLYVDPRAQDFEMGMPRVAIAVRAGDEILGSVWAAVPGPLGAERAQSFRDAAKVVALHMLRLRAGADVERRLRADLVSRVLEGGTAAPEALARLGLLGRPLTVLAMGTAGAPGPTTPEEDVSRAAGRQRLADALATHLTTVQPRSAVALLGDVAYGLVPLPGGQPDGAERALRLASAFLEHAGRGTEAAAIGVGPPAEDGAGVRRSREGADRALRVLRTAGRGRRVATLEDVHIDALLLELGDLAAARGDRPTAAIARLLDYDARHGAQLLHTLRCWLDAFGDVPAASARAHVHPNTFRYRLRRLTEVARLDLTDPDQRFAAMLQLRLLPTPTLPPEGTPDG
ncbi:helix-turn-helix domain-containing protein [Streptomyces sp. NBC_00670]|uniref:helix-turn-helix domain-containing protein n=1 Tax=Streptomyces sp. NBC_00670 TaxID=2975804 RepID=UPI002E301376|nr:helix-turn-helix domain-containing protein [Streptomyces sp. NBC_00670]